MITFICPSIRPKYWDYIQKSIHHNKIKYEILFIGPKKLGYKQTDNCKFIKILCQTKPVLSNWGCH